MLNQNGQTIRVGAQVITWDGHVREQMPRILAFLHDEGYEGVEIGMRHFDLGRPNEYRELLARHELQLVAAHSGGTFWNKEQADAEMANIEQAIRFAASIGSRYFALSGNKQETVETMQVTAGAYNRIGGLCREAGLQLAYHNHNWEFAREGALFQSLLDHTDPDLVRLVPDIAWLHRAGLDPAQFLERHNQRIAYVHLKDTHADRFCELGQGSVNVDSVLARLSALEADWCVVEQDTTDTTPERSLAVSAEYLRNKGLLSCPKY